MALLLSLITLLALGAGLEALHGRPFLASSWGHLLGWGLRGRRLPTAPPLSLYEVRWLPAVGFVAAAQSWGEVVLVKPGFASPQLLAHEARHAAQYRRYTSVGFWLLYLGGWLGGLARYRDPFRAYWEIPLEREARRAAKRAQLEERQPGER